MSSFWVDGSAVFEMCWVNVRRVLPSMSGIGNAIKISQAEGLATAVGGSRDEHICTLKEEARQDETA